MSDREEYYVYYYDDKNENIPVIKHIDSPPSNENQIVVHNNTNYDNNLSDTSFMLMSLFFHFIVILAVFELGKRNENIIFKNRYNNCFFSRFFCYG